MTADGVATVIMLAVGGPHVFVTFTRTNMDPRFVRRHRVYTSVAYLIPFATAAFALLYTPLFLTVFFTWASLHVLQQIIYVSDCYTARQATPPRPWERLVEYGVVLSCLYPFAAVRMSEGTFRLDNTKLLVPEAILGTGLIVFAFGVFGIFLLAWLVLTIRGAVRGTLHYGKTALIGATVAATFFTPLFHNLDVAFQGINSWHCIQYLALVWWSNRIRAERGETQIGFVKYLSEKGLRGFLRYYLTSVALTAGVVGLIYVIYWIFPRISPLLAYYMVGKGLLLVHYYYDTFLFTQRDVLRMPAAAPAAA
jgi:hypothetical protein